MQQQYINSSLATDITILILVELKYMDVVWMFPSLNQESLLNSIYLMDFGWINNFGSPHWLY